MVYMYIQQGAKSQESNEGGPFSDFTHITFRALWYVRMYWGKLEIFWPKVPCLVLFIRWRSFNLIDRTRIESLPPFSVLLRSTDHYFLPACILRMYICTWIKNMMIIPSFHFCECSIYFAEITCMSKNS